MSGAEQKTDHVTSLKPYHQSGGENESEREEENLHDQLNQHYTQQGREADVIGIALVESPTERSVYDGEENAASEVS